MAKHFLREWRKHRGFSLKELAEVMQGDADEPVVSYVSLSRIERGIQPYSQPILEAAAKALDCKPGDILSRDPTRDRPIMDMADKMMFLSPEKQEMILTMIRSVVEPSAR